MPAFVMHYLPEKDLQLLYDITINSEFVIKIMKKTLLKCVNTNSFIKRKIGGIMFNFNRKRQYINTLNIIADRNIQKLRSKVKILIIDDEEYGIVDILKERKYSIFYKNDIDYSIEAEPFDIIILDIKGIAKKMSSPMEGFAMANEIKKIYPHKKVLCFSGAVIEQGVAEKLSRIDGYIPKDNGIDQWADKLDEIIKDYVSIEYHQNVLENQLKNMLYSDEAIQEILKEFANTFTNKSYDKLSDLLIKKIKDVETITSILGIVFNLFDIFSA